MESLELEKLKEKLISEEELEESLKEVGDDGLLEQAADLKDKLDLLNEKEELNDEEKRQLSNLQSKWMVYERVIQQRGLGEFLSIPEVESLENTKSAENRVRKDESSKDHEGGSEEEEDFSEEFAYFEKELKKLRGLAGVAAVNKKELLHLFLFDPIRYFEDRSTAYPNKRRYQNALTKLKENPRLVDKWQEYFGGIVKEDDPQEGGILEAEEIEQEISKEESLSLYGRLDGEMIAVKGEEYKVEVGADGTLFKLVATDGGRDEEPKVFSLENFQGLLLSTLSKREEGLVVKGNKELGGLLMEDLQKEKRNMARREQLALYKKLLKDVEVSKKEIEKLKKLSVTDLEEEVDKVRGRQRDLVKKMNAGVQKGELVPEKDVEEYIKTEELLEEIQEIIDDKKEEFERKVASARNLQEDLRFQKMEEDQQTQLTEGVREEVFQAQVQAQFAQAYPEEYALYSQIGWLGHLLSSVEGSRVRFVGGESFEEKVKRFWELVEKRKKVYKSSVK